MRASTLTCRSCGSEFQPTDFDPSAKQVTCPLCWHTAALPEPAWLSKNNFPSVSAEAVSANPLGASRQVVLPTEPVVPLRDSPPPRPRAVARPSARRRNLLLGGIAFAVGFVVLGGIAAVLIVAGLVLHRFNPYLDYGAHGPGVGLEAPEIEGKDLSANPMRLSDYRGKVIVLDFWAGWCPFCRLAFAGHKRLVKRLEGEPFVLLGVTQDWDLATAQRVEQEDQLPWRSWYDGPAVGSPITTRYVVDALPTTFVIDHHGVIRYRFEGAQPPDVLDRAVDELLEEARKEKR